MNKEEKKQKRELAEWNKEQKLIPVMIKKYCRGKHKKERKELGLKHDEICPECKELTDYALFRLSKCPFKVNKKFCSFCNIHCYKPDMRVKIKDVMRYSGPRMLPTHPIFAMSHVFQMVSYKKKLKKEQAQKAANEAPAPAGEDSTEKK